MVPPLKDTINLIIAGVGGQGNIVASQILALAALTEGMYATIGETYGVSQRGGSVMSHVRISRTGSSGPLIPLGRGDIIVGFEPLETFKVAMEYAHSNTSVLCNPRPVYPIGVLSGDFGYPPVERMLSILRQHVSELKIIQATRLAHEIGEIRSMNIVMVGAIAGAGLLPMKRGSYYHSLQELFKGDALKKNQKAFEKGLIASSRPYHPE